MEDACHGDADEWAAKTLVGIPLRQLPAQQTLSHILFDGKKKTKGVPFCQCEIRPPQTIIKQQDHAAERRQSQRRRYPEPACRTTENRRFDRRVASGIENVHARGTFRSYWESIGDGVCWDTRRLACCTRSSVVGSPRPRSRYRSISLAFDGSNSSERSQASRASLIRFCL